jgi:xanthine dehydrogenase accessory factor
MEAMAELTELGAALANWQLADTAVCAVRLTAVQGLGATSPAPLLLTDGTTARGSLLGGAADATALQLAGQVLEDGTALRSELQLGASEATDAGLACAGSATVLAHLVPPAQAELLADRLRSGGPVAMLACAGGVLVVAGHEDERVASELDVARTEQALEQVRPLLRRGTCISSAVELAGEQVPVDVWVATAGVLIVGAGALRDALAAQAELLGWNIQVTTGVAETEQAVAGLTAVDAMVLLDHDPDFDGALLRCARGPAFPGALGSRHTQAARGERLANAGATSVELDRIHGPIGLDLGARTSAETAVSVVAEIIAWRAGRAPQALGAATGRIGG